MNNKLIILVFCLILAPIVQAGLVDWTTFETSNLIDSRTATAGDFSTWFSANNFNCTNSGHYPNCTYSGGAGGTGDSYWAIVSESSNKFLRMTTSGASFTDFDYIQLYWNHINMTLPSNDGVTYKFRIRLSNTWSGTSARNNNYNAGGLRFNTYGSDCLSFTSGKISTFDSVMTFDLMRSGETSTLMSNPINITSCSIDDGSWHSVYVLNTKYNITNYTVFYIDGIKCYENAITPNLPFDKIFFTAGNDYTVDIDDIYLYNTSLVPVSNVSTVGQLETNCPVLGCLFYDDFTYATNSSMSTIYNYSEGLVENISNSQLFLESDLTCTPKGCYSVTAELPEYTYKKIYSVIKFTLNNLTPTPSTMQNFPVIYALTAECNGEIANYEQFYFVRDDTFSMSENSTVISIYMVLDGQPRNIGTLTLDNGQSFFIKTTYALDEKQAYIYVVRDTDTVSYNPESYTYKAPFNIPCNPDSFAIWRLDQFNTINYFIGIDRIFWYGENDNSINATQYTYINATPRNESLISGDVAEYAKDAAESFGLRTPESKLIAALVIIGGVIIFAVSKLNKYINPWAMSLVVGVLLVGSVYLVYRLGFITSGVFYTFIIVASIVGAFTAKSMFSNGNTQG